MRQQYGLRIQSEEFARMGWEEFADLLGGLNEQTPLARVAMIRTESDPERVRAMTPEQRRMRAEWRRRRAHARTPGEVERFLSAMQGAFASLSGKGA